MSRRSSDLDFGDVFGGPPRRSGVYDRQSGRADSFDSSAYPRGRSRGGDERLPFQKSTSSSGLVEKPVFGELNSPARRRHLADNFFDDIFPGSDQSGNSTPRRAEQDVFSPTPGSRVLSPNRPVPVGGSSLLPRHSLPVKVVKGVEYPFHSARIQPSTFKIEDGGAPEFLYMPNSSPYADEVLIEPKSAGKVFNNLSPLTRQLSQDMDEASSMESQSQKDRISLENYINSKQFHFSIYKWAGKGVSLNLPSNSKEGTDPVSRMRRLAEVVIQSVDMKYDDDKVPAATGAPNNQSENKDKTLPNDIPMDSKDGENLIMTEDTSPLETGPKNSSRDLTENSGKGMMTTSNEDVPATISDPIKPRLRKLSQLLSDFSEEKGIEETTTQNVPEESFTGGPRDQPNIKDEYKANKKRAQDENKTVPVEAAVNHDIQDFPAVSEDKVPGKKAKGKVKDFIKIFSQEGSPKRKATSETEDRKSKGKDRTKNKVDEQINMSFVKEEEEVKDSYTRIEQPSVAAAVELNETSKEDVIHHFTGISDVHTTDGTPTERDDNLHPSSESVKESINISFEESPYEDFEGCLVEEVSQDQNELLQGESEQDQIKTADVKIREWSKGKEGNIRSLLSTLQYVLWPESGWKPIPLVNIIEGSSVKRSYQRALLCLHPDKLQQRGAAMHQKYIAEKVFDILQEAWDQFNSLSVF